MAGVTPNVFEIGGRKFVMQPGWEIVQLRQDADGRATDVRNGQPYRVPPGKTFTALLASIHNYMVGVSGRGGGTWGSAYVSDRDNITPTQKESDSRTRAERIAYSQAANAQTRLSMETARAVFFELKVQIVFKQNKYIQLGGKYSNVSLLGIEA